MEREDRDDDRKDQPAARPSFVAMLDAEAESLAQTARFTLHAAWLAFHDDTCERRLRPAMARRRR